MPSFSFKKAQQASAITSKEIERLACLFLVVQDQVKVSGEQYETAAAEFGGTKGSFQFAYRTILKKLKEKGCIISEDQSEVDNATTTTPTPTNTRKKTNKRKDNGEGDEDKMIPPASKKTRNSRKEVINPAIKEEHNSEGEEAAEGQTEDA